MKEPRSTSLLGTTSRQIFCCYSFDVVSVVGVVAAAVVVAVAASDTAATEVVTLVIVSVMLSSSLVW